MPRRRPQKEGPRLHNPERSRRQRASKVAEVSKSGRYIPLCTNCPFRIERAKEGVPADGVVGYSNGRFCILPEADKEVRVYRSISYVTAVETLIKVCISAVKSIFDVIW